ncbi:MAG: GTPase Era [Defluviitaleaceae bacterium]|nr:GTPase Era [Defluviitaleaceae bacterium]
MNSFKSGFVSLVGRPNVGKSTLTNLFVGEKIAITSFKPQTTRNRIRGILTREDCQIVFIDTPGLHRPKNRLGEFMAKNAEAAIREADVTLCLTEPKLTEGDKFAIDALRAARAKSFLVINKTDTVEREKLLALIDGYSKLYPFAEIFPVSALKGDNTDALLAAVINLLPEGPMYYPSDIATDQPERQIVSELIREKALLYLREEIPHGVAVEVTFMTKRKSSDIVDTEATVFCEKDSHKSIVIGKNGETLKKIGTSARRDIESLLGSQINLQLWVKIKKNWRDNDFLLKNFGYGMKSVNNE